MLFNSYVFVGFFVIVYVLYLIFKRLYRVQNRILLVASYAFYAYWDWRFLSLIALSTIIDYLVGLALHKSKSQPKRKFLLFLSVAANLSILGFFKYYNFFADSLADILGMFGMEAGFVTLNLVLPVGISFFTLQTMSYSIDIYRGKIEPTRNVLDFALFVAFFPKLVAGPIERASNLLPQITSPRRIRINQLNAGLFLILWGYYKKIVIADNLGKIADQIFNGYTQFQGLDLLVGVLAFAVQILCDFSGYSDIARGLAKVMGFDLMVNFKLPYFAVNPRDFWQRWHVSLSSWLRNYLYIPMGGNKGGKIATHRNLAITMLLGGLWHGASWNFVLWGAFHGLILSFYRLFDKEPVQNESGKVMQYLVKIPSKMLLMFVLTLIGWVLFRSSSADQILYVFSNIFGGWSEQTLDIAHTLLFFSLPLVVIQVYQYIRRDLLAPIKLNPIIRIPLYAHLIIWIIIFGVREATEFIYFQF